MVETEPVEPLLGQEVDDPLEVGRVGLSNRVSEAGLEADLEAVFDAADGRVERAVLAAEAIVSLGEAVDGDAGVLEASVPQRRGLLAGEQGSVRGENRPEAEIGRVRDEFDQVLSNERLAAGEEDDRRAVVGQLLEECPPLGGGELAGRRLGLGPGVAVRAIEVTPAGRVPDDDGPALFLVGDLGFRSPRPRRSAARRLRRRDRRAVC